MSSGEKPRMVSVETMRKSDAYTIENLVPSLELMRRAGEGIYRSARWKEPVAVICGSGNNAGDGYVVAELLHSNGIMCRIILVSDRFSQDGKYYYERAVKAGVPVERFDDNTDLTVYGSILDCLLGTGFKGTVNSHYSQVIHKINSSGAYVVSADINSGLNGDTGTGDLYVVSDLTVSIGTFKYGHFLGAAEKAMKEKVNCDIGIEIIQ